MQMKMENDILNSSKDLKSTPFKVPEGYFDQLKSEIRKNTEPRIVRMSIWTRLAPYAAIAAMFLFILTLGKLFIKDNYSGEDISISNNIGNYEDYLVFNDFSTDLSMHYLEDEPDESTILNDEDIIEYLIYIGASEQYIEY